VLALVFAFCLAPSGMAQQGDAQPSTAPPAGWSEQKMTEAEKAQQLGDPEYIVGDGDVLRIEVWKEPEVSQNAITVRPDGMISLPLLGVTKVSEMTPTQIQDMLAVKLSRFMNKPEVTVTVTQIKSKSVYVTGEVRKPGVYELTRPTNVFQLLIRAGGLSQYAHRKSVVVLRVADGKTQRLPVNYKQLLRGKNEEQNIILQPGDTVVVP
jgi:polysaccharide export outer membrane protein